MNNSSFPKLADNIHIETIAVEKEKKLHFFLDPTVPSWVIVNEDGAQLLQLCNGKRSTENIAESISRHRSGIKFTDVLQWVDSFIQQMEKKLIINAKPDTSNRENSFHGLALEITKKCNLRCRHCYLAAGKAAAKELSNEEIKTLINATKEEGGVSVAIGGGEPLLRNDCLDIIEYALSCDLLVSLGTNATLIDENLAVKLADLPIKIQISLDGATEGVHDYIRGEGSYRAAVRGIEALVQKGKAGDMVIAFTPMKSNVQEVPAIIEFARDRQIPVIQYPPLTPSGRAKESWEELRLNNDEMLKFWKTIYIRSAELQGEIDLLADCFSINIHQAGSPYQCSIGTQFRIDPSGDVYPCQCFHYGTKYLLGNVRDSSLNSMIKGKKIKEIKKISQLRPSMIDSCSACKWHNYCGAGCMGNAFETTGTVLHSSSCEVRKRWIESLFSKTIEQTKQSLFT